MKPLLYDEQDIVYPAYVVPHWSPLQKLCLPGMPLAFFFSLFVSRIYSPAPGHVVVTDIFLLPPGTRLHLYCHIDR